MGPSNKNSGLNTNIFFWFLVWDTFGLTEGWDLLDEILATPLTPVDTFHKFRTVSVKNDENATFKARLLTLIAKF